MFPKKHDSTSHWLITHAISPSVWPRDGVPRHSVNRIVLDISRFEIDLTIVGTWVLVAKGSEASHDHDAMIPGLCMVEQSVSPSGDRPGLGC